MRTPASLSFLGVIVLTTTTAHTLNAQPVGGSAAECTISRVVDGDSFECRGGTRVRMLLIDAPEMAQRPYGDSARAAARSLLPLGRKVRLEVDVRREDQFGRLLAYVYAGPVFVNRELVRRGMAVVLVYPPNVREVEALRAASDSARQERRGLWSGSAFTCTPRDYRARRCR